MIHQIAELTGYTAEEIAGYGRKNKQLVDIRHLYWMYLYDFGFTYQDIAKLSGGRNHATIIYGVNAMRNMLSVGYKQAIWRNEQLKGLQPTSEMLWFFNAKKSNRDEKATN
jgi:chromosomal replication initiation ATPase DnaA